MRGTAVRRAVFAGRARPSVPSYLFYLRAVMRSPNASSDPPTPCWSLPRTPPHTLLCTGGRPSVDTCRRLFALSDLRDQPGKLLSRSVHIVFCRVLTAAMRHLRSKPRLLYQPAQPRSDLRMVHHHGSAVNLGIGYRVGDHAGGASVGCLQHGDTEGLMVRARKGNIHIRQQAPVVDLSGETRQELNVAQTGEPRQGPGEVVFEAPGNPEGLIPVLVPADKERHVSMLGRQGLDDVQRTPQVLVGAPAVLPQHREAGAFAALTSLAVVDSLEVEETDLKLKAFDALLQKALGEEAVHGVSLEVGHDICHRLEESIHMHVLLPVPAGKVVRIEGPKKRRNPQDVVLA